MNNNNSKKKLLLHACCAPCLTAVNEKLETDYNPIVFWFNPNIEPKIEHARRLSVLKEFCELMGLELIDGALDYDRENADWLEYIRESSEEPEGGNRCKRCIEFRLLKTAKRATEMGLDFATTLSVSPHKNANLINDIGQGLSQEPHINFLTADFKKKNGYLRSIKLSKKFGLYRQNYCGCRFSQRKIDS